MPVVAHNVNDEVDSLDIVTIDVERMGVIVSMALAMLEG
jgi:hypothetical protein